MVTPLGSPRQDRSLTTTSYAVLSILALREHATYDLTRQMRLSLHYLWPRAESNVYAEPPRLVADGLATAREEWRGRRRRTVYAITPAGRAALARWLAAASSRQRYESEALIKVLFAENGTREDLLASIRSIADDATDVIGHFRGIADRYAAGEGEYPDRFPLSALAVRLLVEQQVATVRWAAWAASVVGGWDRLSSADVRWAVDAIRASGRPVDANSDPAAPLPAAPKADRRERPGSARSGDRGAARS